MNLYHLFKKSIAAAVILTCVDSAYAASEFAPNKMNPVLVWNNALLDAVRTTNPPPPVVARMLGIAHSCIYDAWASYDGRAQGAYWTQKQRRPKFERTERNRLEAITYAAYTAAVDLFPTQKAEFDKTMTSLGYSLGRNSGPARVGTSACEQVLKVRHYDGSNQMGDLHTGAYSDYTGYLSSNTPEELFDVSYWQPLIVPDGKGGYRTQSFLMPHWGHVQPFAFEDPKQFRVKPPAAYGSRSFMEQAREVISYSANLTDTQKMIAEYWADGPRTETPPGHWNVLAQEVSRRDRHTTEQDVKMFFALNNAVMDAGIIAWWVKVEFDSVRPVTAINHLFKGEMIRAWAGPNLGTDWVLGENWRPYQAATFVTPPFAEYISGHSTFSAAAAEVLRSFTNSDVFGHSVTFAAGSSGYEPSTVPAAPLALSWATFSDAADEAGVSRIYGGIHFRDGDREGRRVGKEVGALVWNKSVRLFNGARPWKNERN